VCELTYTWAGDIDGFTIIVSSSRFQFAVAVIPPAAPAVAATAEATALAATATAAVAAAFAAAFAFAAAIDHTVGRGPALGQSAYAFAC
jgi:VIT1/CCC1 family predicted Fe2+/Mn2+ transporter